MTTRKVNLNRRPQKPKRNKSYKKGIPSGYLYDATQTHYDTIKSHPLLSHLLPSRIVPKGAIYRHLNRAFMRKVESYLLRELKELYQMYKWRKDVNDPDKEYLGEECYSKRQGLSGSIASAWYRFRILYLMLLAYMLYLEGWSNVKIGEALGVSDKTAKKYWMFIEGLIEKVKDAGRSRIGKILNNRIMRMISPEFVRNERKMREFFMPKPEPDLLTVLRGYEREAELNALADADIRCALSGMNL